MQEDSTLEMQDEPTLAEMLGLYGDGYGVMAEGETECIVCDSVEEALEHYMEEHGVTFTSLTDTLPLYVGVLNPDREVLETREIALGISIQTEAGH